MSTNFPTQMDYEVFGFFELEGLICSCFVKERCKALDPFRSIVVTHNDTVLATEQTQVTQSCSASASKGSCVTHNPEREAIKLR